LGTGASPVQAERKLGSAAIASTRSSSTMPRFLRRGLACLGKPKLMLLHIHPSAAKRNSLHPQTKFLLCPILALQLNRTTRAHYPMPRQSRTLAQNAHHLPRRARPSRRTCNRSVTRHLADWQSTNASHHASTPSFADARGFSTRRLFPGLRFQIPPRHARTANAKHANLDSTIQIFTHRDKTRLYD